MRKFQYLVEYKKYSSKKDKKSSYLKFIINNNNHFDSWIQYIILIFLSNDRLLSYKNRETFFIIIWFIVNLMLQLISFLVKRQWNKLFWGMRSIILKI
jgi:hypothetical protein